MSISLLARNKVNRLLQGTLVAATFSIAALAPLQANAGILTGVDILNISGIVESSLTYGNMTAAKAELIGAGATVTSVSIGSFSAANLAGIEILYVGLVNARFTAAQVAVINAYVAGGGGLVAVGTEHSSFSGPSWEQLANSFGLFGLGGERNAKANASAPASPIVNGPFGIATSYQPALTGAFKTPLPAGATSVWEGVDNNPIIVTLNVTGRASFFADTNFMEDGFITNGNNATIWGNAFAFSGNVGAVPEPETYAMMLAGLGVIGFAARRRRS